MRKRFARDESGFTLIESVISLAILGIIIGPISMSFFIGMLESNSTRDRVADAASAQLISSYLVTDIESAGDQVSTTAQDCVPGFTVAGATPPDAVVLQLESTDPSTSVQTIVDYIDHDSGGTVHQHELWRTSCNSSGNTSTLVANYLKNPGGFAVSCDDGTCADPSTVTVSITATSKAPQSASSYTPYPFQVQATRRTKQ